MQIVGRDGEGHLIGVQRGLIKTTVYKSSERVPGLNGLDDLGFDWNQLFSGINSNPLIIGLGQKIAGQGGGVVPINAYGGSGSPNVYASGPGFGGAMNPMYIMLGGAALLMVLMMRR